MVDKSKAACFSGHRKLPQDITVLKADLKNAIMGLINCGVTFFGNGGALGFDLLAAETILQLKEEYPHIRLIMVLPCPPEQQTLKWNEKQRKQYQAILKQADKIQILSPRYTNNCMFDRNRHLVDNSAYLICYLREQQGGTFYTVNYAKKQGLKILSL